MSSFSLTITSPDGNIFKGNAERLVVRGSEGELAVLAGHAPFVTALAPCECRVHISENEVKSGRLEGGLLAVGKDNVVILSSSLVLK